MEAVASLVNLVTLNLQNNSITEIDGEMTNMAAVPL